jgi:Fe-S-cluster-containing dehydrogenase component/anaerobic selenocysteine-containing dehydrogenase
MMNSTTPNTDQKNLNKSSAEAQTFTTPRHWIGVEELSESYWQNEANLEKRAQEFHDKPVETIDLIDRLDSKGFARRDFLTLMGASMAMASFACARRPVHKIIPYVVKPEEITHGVANYYATTCPETGYGVLAKVREGRPIKLEGNPEHGMSSGKLSVKGQAAILDLYDMDRAKEPKKLARGKGSRAIEWEKADAEISAKLKEIAAGSGRVRVVSAPLKSDSTKRLVGEFLSAFAAGSQVEFDPALGDEVLSAQVDSYGTAVVPHYRFDEADVVVSFAGDFLGTHENETEYSRDWAKKRRLSGKNATLSKLFVIETMMSTTGANADERFPVRSGDELKVAAAIAGEVARKKGVSVPSELASYGLSAVAEETGISAEKLKEIADELVKNAGKSIVLGGGFTTRNGSALALQVVINFLNSTLGNEGKTVDGTAQAFTKTGDRRAAVDTLISDMNRGAVDALILYRANWVYQLPKSIGFEAALAKVPFVVSISDSEDETALKSDFHLPDQHFLESWGDAQPRKGIVSLQQPTLAPIHASRSFQDSLIVWAKSGLKVKGLLANSLAGTWYDYLRANWKEGALKGVGNFEAAWENALREGVVKSDVGSPSARTFKSSSLAIVPGFKKADRKELSYVSYSKISIGDGTRANNPWLQEMPDPVTTATWDNYLAMSVKTAESLKLKQDDVASIEIGGEKLELPVMIQPGLALGVVAAAVGYGRTAAGKIGTGVGRDVKCFAKTVGSELAYSGFSAKVKATGKRYQIAVTQWHNATENRPIVNDLTLAEYKANPGASNHTDPHMRLKEVPTMWPKHEYKGYKWGMSIDLTACTGCGACVIACQAENNIPVVGRDNVRKSREMHWIRIDRYYSGSAENPDVVFQPMLCQHCENAPCETVCPVLATVHDDEGMNTQVYNRCVGTRYCQNNCPYKVRRFNFFDHWKSYEGTMNMAWNPDVTVRTRGIMEKCSFCVQRIRDSKQKAKEEGRKVRDGEVLAACQQTCPSDAIVFGNVNDPESLVSQMRGADRAFRVLEVLNTVPSISYLSKVRNKEAAAGAHGGGHEGTAPAAGKEEKSHG